MNRDLFLAILAMDAYNRGYNAGIAGLSDAVGTQIGNALISRGVLDTDSAAVSSGFYAIAYNWNGEKVVSYRGTDSNFGLAIPVLSGDLANGYGLAVGAPYGPQANLAIDFYKDVAGSNLTPEQLRAANVTLTGHSLGGGLAGFVGAIYGKQGLLFDNMPFELSASAAYNDAAYLYLGGEVTPAYVQAELFRQKVYGADAPFANNRSGLSGYAVTGEFLTPARLLQSTPVANLDSSTGFGTLNPITQLHAQDLLVLLLYAQQNGFEAWRSISPNFIPVMFNQGGQQIGTALGLGQFAGPGADNDLAGVMRDLIAYTAIDEGFRPFGTTGIRALFDDANQIGSLASAQDTAAYLKDDSVQKALADIFIEYAGLLARNKDFNQSEPQQFTGHEKGALYYDQNANRLIGDFARDLWKKIDDGNVGAQVDIIGKKTLTDAVSRFGEFSRASVDDAVDRLWAGNTDHVIKLVAATKDIAVTLDAVADAQIGQQPNPLPIDGAMLVGAGGNDRIVGAKGNDLLIGGKGEDTLIGGRGDDLMFGGAGKDTFKGYDQTTPPPQDDAQATGYEGNDWMDGGAGEDTVDYSRLPNAVMYTISEERIGSNVVVKITDPATDTTPASTDYLVSVEKVKLTDKADTIKVDFASVIKDPSVRTTIDGDAAPAEASTNEELGDRLDFSASTSPALIGAAKDQTSAEIFTKWQPITQDATFVYNVIKPSGAATGAGLTDATGLRFTNFEDVTGTSGDDILGLWWLNPSGELNAEQEQAFKAAQNITVSFASGNPAQIGAALDARMEQARLIPQNQQDVVLEGGAGKDIILGTRTGADRIYGGDGNDKLYAGGFTSAIYGGARTD
jgi:serralysin